MVRIAPLQSVLLPNALEANWRLASKGFQIWLVVDLPIWKIWVHQLEWLFPIYGKIKNVPNHQPGCHETTWATQKQTCFFSHWTSLANIYQNLSLKGHYLKIGWCDVILCHFLQFECFLLGGSSYESQVGFFSLVVGGLILLIPLITGDITYTLLTKWDDPPGRHLLDLAPFSLFWLYFEAIPFPAIAFSTGCENPVTCLWKAGR